MRRSASEFCTLLRQLADHFDREPPVTRNLQPRHALIAYSRDATHVQTTFDYLVMLGRNLGLPAQFVHVTNDAIMDFDLNAFDVVINSYCVRHCFENYVSKSFRDALKRYRGLKVMAVQDEYDHTNRLKAAIKDLGFHIVLTCVPQSDLEFVYPRAEFPNVDFLSVFTGYVSDSLLARSVQTKPLTERPIFIGYRGRDIGGKYGRLAFDKYEIGRRMKEECDARGIATDIAMDEASRIYGTAWFDFIGNCRAMLGTESGSNVFDFDGSLDRKYKELTASGGKAPSYQVFEPFVAPRESEINMGQISPRIFECAALRTPMILFRGRYSDALTPEEHYILLEKDFSNIDAVLAHLNDLPALEALVERAHCQLIGSGDFTYEVFCRRVRQAIDQKFAVLAASGWPTRPEFAPPVLHTLHDRSLAERPIDHPLDGVSRQVRRYEINNAVTTAEIARLDNVFLEALDHYQNVISATIEVRPVMADDPRVKRARGLFETNVNALHRARNEFRADDVRLRAACKQEDAVAPSPKLAEPLAELGRLQQEWISSYNRLYDASRSSFQEVLAAIQSRGPPTLRLAVLVFKPADRLLQVLRRWLLRLAVRVFKLADRVLEVLRRLPLKL